MGLNSEADAPNEIMSLSLEELLNLEISRREPLGIHHTHNAGETMIKPRRGEEHDNDCVRTQRYFETDEGWFLRTREGIPVGPYDTAFDVEVAASLLSPKLAQAEKTSEIVATIQAFRRDPAYGPIGKVTLKPRFKPVAKTSFWATKLPAIRHSLKRGCADFIEQTVHVSRLAKVQISKFKHLRSGTSRTASLRSVQLPAADATSSSTLD